MVLYFSSILVAIFCWYDTCYTQYTGHTDSCLAGRSLTFDTWRFQMSHGGHQRGMVNYRERLCHIGTVKYLPQILDIRWYQHVTNADILSLTGLSSLTENTVRRREAIFNHIAQRADKVSAASSISS